MKKIFLLIFLLIARNGYGAACTDLKNDAVSYWNLTEATGVNRADSVTGTANDLTPSGSVVRSTGTGPAGQDVVQFGGTFDPGFLYHDSNSSLQVTGDFAFSFWFNTSGSALLDERQLISKDAVGARDYGLDILGNSVDATHSSNRFYVNGGGSAIVTGTTYITGSVWHHVVVWYQTSSQKVSQVYDLGSTETSSGTDGLTQTTAQFRIGARVYTGFEGYFAGAMAMVGFWKCIPTATMITQLNNSGAGLTYANLPTGGGAPAPIRHRAITSSLPYPKRVVWFK